MGNKYELEGVEPERVQYLTSSIIGGLAYNARDEVSLKFEQVKPVLGQWLVTGNIYMIHGGSGYGKTWVVLGAALSLATGIQFVPNWEVFCDPCKVLMIDGEMSPDTLRDRRQGLINGHEQTIKKELLENLITVSNIHMGSKGELFVDLSKPLDRVAMFEYIVEQDFKVVFLDNLSCLIPGINLKKSEEYSPFNVWLLSLKARGIIIIFVHHDNKSGGFTGANEMEFQVQSRLHVKQATNGFQVCYEKVRHMEKGKSDIFSIMGSDHSGYQILTGQPKGTIVGDAMQYIGRHEGTAGKDEVIDHLVELGHDRTSARNKINTEKNLDKGRFWQSGESLILTE